MEKIIERWYDMIRINSISGHEVDMADYVAGELRKMGIEPHYSYFDGDDEKVRPSIWATLDSGKPGKKFMLIGHIDTVGIGKGWNTDPFEPTEIDGKVYGRGAMDMKGGLAAILETLEYYTAHKDEFSGQIVACFVADEEVLSHGTYQIAKEGVTADYAIMAECRYDNVAIGFRGRYAFDVTVKGVAAHTKDYPQAGVSALIRAGKVAEAFEALPTATHPTLKHGTWCVKYIEGGAKGVLIVPANIEMVVERYVVPGETIESCMAQMEEAVKALGLEGWVDIKLRPRDNGWMQAFSLKEDDYIVTTLRDKFTEVTGEILPVDYDMSVCDSNILAVTMGIPTVTFGPSGGNMHGDNEYGFAYQVKNCAEIYKKVVNEVLK